MVPALGERFRVRMMIIIVFSLFFLFFFLLSMNYLLTFPPLIIQSKIFRTRSLIMLIFVCLQLKKLFTQNRSTVNAFKSLRKSSMCNRIISNMNQNDLICFKIWTGERQLKNEKRIKTNQLNFDWWDHNFARNMNYFFVLKLFIILEVFHSAIENDFRLRQNRTIK